MIIEHLNKVDSTNKYILRYVKDRQDAIVYADEQTDGAGTKGRSFISEKGGLYVSFLKFYRFLPAKNAFKIMLDYSVGVVKTLAAFGIKAQIKWPNDIYVNGKKICGILIKNSFSGELVDYSIAGIGINVNNDIAAPIKDIAISMKSVAQNSFNIDSVLMSLSANVFSENTIQEYREHSLVLGKKIKVIRNNSVSIEQAEDITEDGRLILKNGEILSAAELDLKIDL